MVVTNSGYGFVCSPKGCLKVGNSGTGACAKIKSAVQLFCKALWNLQEHSVHWVYYERGCRRETPSNSRNISLICVCSTKAWSERLALQQVSMQSRLCVQLKILQKSFCMRAWEHADGSRLATGIFTVPRRFCMHPKKISIIVRLWTTAEHYLMHDRYL